MAVLTRIHDFTAGTLIKSSEVDAEFNQIVDILRGVKTDTVLALDVQNQATSAGALVINRGGTGGSGYVLDVFDNRSISTVGAFRIIANAGGATGAQLLFGSVGLTIGAAAGAVGTTPVLTVKDTITGVVVMTVQKDGDVDIPVGALSVEGAVTLGTEGVNVDHAVTKAYVDSVAGTQVAAPTELWCYAGEAVGIGTSLILASERWPAIVMDSATTSDRAVFPFHLPVQWDDGTVAFEVYLVGTTASTTQVRLQIGARAVAVGATVAADDSIANQLFNMPGAADQLVKVPVTGVSVTLISGDVIMSGRILRDATHVDDTYDGDVRVIAMRAIHTPA